MTQAKSITVRASALDTSELSKALQDILSGKPMSFPALRMAPDLTINYIRGEEALIIDVYANGSLLKERISGTAWRVSSAADFLTLMQQNLVQMKR